MKQLAGPLCVGLVASLFAGASVCGSSALARDQKRHHGRHGSNYAAPVREATQPDGGPAEGRDPPRGPFAGAGGIYSPDYEVPGGEVYHAGGQLLGGDFGKAYEDYYRHLYYYKYAYCPIGSTYVIYERRCVSPLDIFR